MIKPFAECDFAVTFSGECPCSKVITGWENVLKYIDEETGGTGDITKGWYKQFDDEDNWSSLGQYYMGNDDERHTWHDEIDECVHLHITRITEYEGATAPTIRVTTPDYPHAHLVITTGKD